MPFRTEPTLYTTQRARRVRGGLADVGLRPPSGVRELKQELLQPTSEVIRRGVARRLLAGPEQSCRGCLDRRKFRGTSRNHTQSRSSRVGTGRKTGP